MRNGTAGTSPDQVRLTNMTREQAIETIETVRTIMADQISAMTIKHDAMAEVRQAETPDARQALARAIKAVRGLSRGTRSARGWQYLNQQIGRGRNFSTQASV